MQNIPNTVHTEAGCWFGNTNAGGGTYKGSPNKHEGLNLWFAEDWRNQRGEVGYKFKSDVYRPTVRVNSKTPTTFKELTSVELKRARREKAAKGRVKQFKNSR